MTQEEIATIQKQIEEEHRQAKIKMWCISHGIDPDYVTYKDGVLYIPLGI